MAFDVKAFNKAKFQPREERVLLPELAAFFGEKEEPAFVVRGLTGEEIARAEEMAEGRKDLAKVLEGLASRQGGEKAEAIKELMGLADGVPGTLAKRLEQVAVGLVNPKLDMAGVVKFAANFPVQFYMVSNTILALSGKGADVIVKKKD